MTDDLKEAVERLTALADMTTVDPTPLDAYGRRPATFAHLRLVLSALKAAERPQPVETFQARVQPWMLDCFGPTIAGDKLERGDRHLEEVLELLQSGGYPRERVAALVDYVYNRPTGEPSQEVGGVMVTLAAYCLAHGLDMHEAAETELARINVPEIVLKIRTKQAAKPTGSALPVAQPVPGDGEGVKGLADEVEQLRLLILGGEDVPGLAASLSFEEVRRAHQDNTMAAQARAEAAERDRDALQAALSRAADRFRKYERLHADKGTPDGDAKANSNADMAEVCERALYGGEKP